MLKEDKCYYCNKLAIAERKEYVDIEAEHDVDTETGETLWYSRPVYQNISVCADHMLDDDEIIR